MDHFQGIVPAERWKNEMLEETRKVRMLLEQLVGGNAQASNQQKHIEHQHQIDKRPYRRKGGQS